jgi:TonB family protein
MKTLLLFTSLFIASFTFGQNIGDTVYYDIQWKKTDQPNSAQYFGIPENKGNDGQLVTYYDVNGDLLSKQMEKNGQREGVCIWYHPNGPARTEGFYLNGKAHGEFLRYNDKGQLIEKTNYLNGKEITFQIIVPETGENDGPLQNSADFPDVEAQFMGGTAGFQKYIFENIIYPQTALENEDQGKVYMSFVVEANGTISQVEIERGVTPELDAEAFRIINAMPNWTPGEARGKAVRTRCRVPIVFKLEGPSPRKETKKEAKKRKKNRR